MSGCRAALKAPLTVAEGAEVTEQYRHERERREQQWFFKGLWATTVYLMWGAALAGIPLFFVARPLAAAAVALWLSVILLRRRWRRVSARRLAHWYTVTFSEEERAEVVRVEGEDRARALAVSEAERVAVAEAAAQAAAESDAAAQRQLQEASVRAREATARRQLLESSPGVVQARAAVQALPASRIYKHAQEDLRDFCLDLGADLAPCEEVLGIAHGTRNGLRQVSIFVTTDRIVVLKHGMLEGGSVAEYRREDGVRLIAGSSLSDGQTLTLTATSGSLPTGKLREKWTAVHPPTAARFLATAWTSGKPATDARPSKVEFKATYLGGTYFGNLVPRTGQARALEANTPVRIGWDGSDVTITVVTKLIGRYSGDSLVLSLQSAASVGRSANVGRVMGAAAGVAAIGIFAAPLLRGTTRASQKEAFVLCVDDTDEGAVFGIHDDAFARQLKFLLREPADAPAPATDPVERLERLLALKERGGLSDEEFERLKAEILEG